MANSIISSDSSSNHFGGSEHQADVLRIRDLQVNFSSNDGVVEAVRGVNLEVKAGECLGIVGESGSGKSQTFLAAMGLLANNAQVRGQVEFDGSNLLTLALPQLNRIRGSRISMIFQNPLTALTPHMRIEQQMREVLQAHQGLDRGTARQRCLDWLEKVRIPEAAHRLRQYPHELSGGMRQRVMIAMAMLCEPKLLIADEPTTALDVTIQAEILDLMDQLRQQHGTAVVLITHDMGVVARMCNRVHVMRYGEFVEQGNCEDLFYRPTHDYTKMLLNAVPRIDALTGKGASTIASTQTSDVYYDKGVQESSDQEGAAVRDAHAESSEPDVEQPASTNADLNASPAVSVLEVRDLRVSFPVRAGWLSRRRELRAVDGISFELAAGESLGVVGESGSGKSTLARAILQLVKSDSGAVTWLGEPLGNLSSGELKRFRQDVQIVFQDPVASLDPNMTVGDSMAEPLRVFEPQLDRRERTRRVCQMMERVGLTPALINRYPHELSGGQNQRIGIARAMISNPRLLICDEAVSALDVSIQAQIVELLRDLQADYSLSLIFISHDLSVVWQVCSRILVMYLGSVVELASREDLFTRPQHPYTQQLISAVPLPDPLLERSRERIKLQGELASPMQKGARLRFLPSQRNTLSLDYVPQLKERFPRHFVAEHDPLDRLVVK